MSCSMKSTDEEIGSMVQLEFRRVADRVYGPGYYHYYPDESWTPAMNLYEDMRNYYAVLNLAGVGSQAIELDVNGGKLTIAGHRPTPPPPEVHGKLKLFHMEIDHGRFCRTLELPRGVDANKIEAVYRAGQLLITMPKVR